MATSPGWMCEPSTSRFRSTTPTQKPARSYSPRWYMSGPDRRLATDEGAVRHSTQASAIPRTICSSSAGSSCEHGDVVEKKRLGAVRSASFTLMATRSMPTVS